MPELECLVYPAHRVRRPVPEVKAIRRAVDMIRVRLGAAARRTGCLLHAIQGA